MWYEEWSGLERYWEAQGVRVHFAALPRDDFTEITPRLLSRKGLRVEYADGELPAVSLVISGSSAGRIGHAPVLAWAERQGVPCIDVKYEHPIVELAEMASRHLRIPPPVRALAGAACRLPLAPVHSPPEWGAPNRLYEQAEYPNQTDPTDEQVAMRTGSWLAHVTWEVQTGRGVRPHDLGALQHALQLKGAWTGVPKLLQAMYLHLSDVDLVAHRGLTSALWGAAGSNPGVMGIDRMHCGLAALAVLRGEVGRTDLQHRATQHLQKMERWLHARRTTLPKLITDHTRAKLYEMWGDYPLADAMVQAGVPLFADPLGPGSTPDVMSNLLTWRIAAQHQTPPRVAAAMVGRHETRFEGRRLAGGSLLQAFVAEHPARSAAILDEWVELIRRTTNRGVLEDLYRGALSWPTFPPAMAEALFRYEGLGGGATLRGAPGILASLPVQATSLPIAMELASRPPGNETLLRIVTRCEDPDREPHALARHEAAVTPARGRPR